MNKSREGGNVVRGFARKNLAGGGGFATRGIPKAPPCLTHTPTCRPMLRSEADRFANQMATESGITSQLMLFQTLAQKPRTHRAQCHSHLHCRRLQTSPGEKFAPFLEDRISHEIVPPPVQTTSTAREHTLTCRGAGGEPLGDVLAGV